jgi:uncharacterized protein YeaO (DUF488 family)
MTAFASWSTAYGPRGVSKADAAIDQWIKDIAPSTALRKWFGHDLAVGKNFADAMPDSCASIRSRSQGCARWRNKARSRSCSLPATGVIMMPSR